MKANFHLKRGLTIKLQGNAEKILSTCERASVYAVQPSDFKGIIPKLLVQEGDVVQAGSPLFCDKMRQQIVFTAPVSGKVRAIVRGEQRKILQVVIDADSEISYLKFDTPDTADAAAIAALSREDIVALMLRSGTWAFLVQRPFGVVAAPDAVPSNIFISGFNTAPLAADSDFLVNNEGENFQIGINVLRKLTSGKVYLSLNADYPANKTFQRAKDVEKVFFKGRHPAGNVGVQIHHIAPMGKGSVVWSIQPQHVAALGRFFAGGEYDVSRVVAVVGSEVKKPRYYRMIAGGALSVIDDLIKKGATPRIISGNVLTGANAGLNGYLGYYDTEVSVIPEGNNYEMLGWAMPRLHRFSSSRTYFSWLFPDKTYSLDTNINGGERALVMNGEYEKVLPMDILPAYLLKAILAGDVERMEQLGIYEVIEEDMALCEFVCSSKTEVQQLLRRGIDMMMNEYK
jgi:Na+-transporting NADH:ubiquinone oxidoreductase subunit A